MTPRTAEEWAALYTSSWFQQLPLHRKLHLLPVGHTAPMFAAAAIGSGQGYDALGIGNPRQLSPEVQAAVRQDNEWRVDQLKDQTIQTKDAVLAALSSRQPRPQHIVLDEFENEKQSLEYRTMQMSERFVRERWKDHPDIAEKIMGLQKLFREGDTTSLEYLAQRRIMGWADTYFLRNKNPETSEHEPYVFIQGHPTQILMRLKGLGVYGTSPGLYNKGSRQIGEKLNRFNEENGRPLGALPATTEWPLIIASASLNDVIAMRCLYVGDGRETQARIYGAVQAIKDNRDINDAYDIIDEWNDFNAPGTPLARVKLVLQPTEYTAAFLGHENPQHPYERVEIQLAAFGQNVQEQQFSKVAYENFKLRRNRTYRIRETGEERTFTKTQVDSNLFFENDFSLD